MNERCEIQGVTFDVGGTLIEPWPSVGSVYADVAARHGWQNISAELLEARFRKVWSECRQFDYTRADWENLVERVFRGLAPGSTRIDFFSALYERFAEPSAWRVFEDVAPALEALASRGVRLGVISNWDERLRILLQRLGLDDYFEAISISCEIGFSKPSPIIFEHTATKLGLPPAAILHVGDSPDMDVRGARAAGFHAVQLVRDGRELNEKTIHTLAAVTSCLTHQISPN